jgi:hypothetical protein
VKGTVLIAVALFTLWLFGLYTVFAILVGFGIVAWLVFTCADFFKALGRWFSRPNITIYNERPQDPTIPDEHPLILLNRDKYRRRK